MMKYDIFLSHKHEGGGLNVAGDLFKKFKKKGCCPFLDRESIGVDKWENAITEAENDTKVVVAICSHNITDEYEGTVFKQELDLAKKLNEEGKGVNLIAYCMTGFGKKHGFENELKILGLDKWNVIDENQRKPEDSQADLVNTVYKYLKDNDKHNNRKRFLRRNKIILKRNKKKIILSVLVVLLLAIMSVLYFVFPYITHEIDLYQKANSDSVVVPENVPSEGKQTDNLYIQFSNKNNTSQSSLDENYVFNDFEPIVCKISLDDINIQNVNNSLIKAYLPTCLRQETNDVLFHDGLNNQDINVSGNIATDGISINNNVANNNSYFIVSLKANKQGLKKGINTVRIYYSISLDNTVFYNEKNIMIDCVKGGWGDSSGGRNSISQDEYASDNTTYRNKAVFNIVSDGVIGDEKNFVNARLNDNEDKGANTIWNGNEITVENNKEYIIRLYVHNCGEVESKNTRVALNIPALIDYEIPVNGFIYSDNAEPDEYWDGIVFKSTHKFHFEYVKDSAGLANNNLGDNGGYKLDDKSLLKQEGTLIGNELLNGIIKPGYKYACYVGIKVKVVFDE